MANEATGKTALDLITGALRKIGQYAPGEPLSYNDAADAMDVLNGMLDIWSNQKYFAYNNIETTFILQPGKIKYTVGPGAEIDMQRPIRITTAYSRRTTGNGAVDFGCDVFSLQQYSAIGLKMQPGPWPKYMFYNMSYPLSSLTLYPMPNQLGEMHFWSDQLLQALALTDSLNLPPGYYLGLQFSLAELLCTEYGIAVPKGVERFAREFKAVIKATNATPQPTVMLDRALMNTAGADAGFILTGGF